MKSDELIKEACSLFPASERPVHFTEPGHCDECNEHDEILIAHTRERIGYDILGNPAWDPICFVNEKGFKYYFPAMVRLALKGTGDEYYVDQFLFHVMQNIHCLSFSNEQAAFVVKVLEFLLESKAEEIEKNSGS